MEFNKIFAALLVAGVVASFSGFLARETIHPHSLHEDAVFVEGSTGAASGSKKPKLPDPVLSLIAQADLERGKKISKACASCHSFDQGGPNGTGPNLWNIVGRKMGDQNSFSYSNSMVEMNQKWDYQALNHFLWKPKAYISGTKMNYVGLKKPEDRAALIAWLRSLSSSPKSLPSAKEIDEEVKALVPEVLEDVQEVMKTESH